jgi:Rrf2 family nitric oxide-sensitive transcriptional repressor
MRLTVMTDYAMRLLMYLGRQPDRLCTIAEVAQAYGISETHLMKITHQLGAGGWIETLRGKGGGIRLARDASEINLGAVVRGIETDFRIVECFASGSPCTLAGDCRLAGVVHGALDAFQQYFDRYTLADILAPEPGAGVTRAEAKVVRLRRRPRLRVA